jgi:hypothetical protein
MPTYLDVGLVRIQKYLNRTPKLTRRRGASALVATATETGALVNAVAGLSANEEAVEADGVVHLIVDSGEPEMAARQVLVYLAQVLPAAEMEASWASAPDYASAHSALEAKRAISPIRMFPSLMDVPLVQRCDGCAQAGVSAHRKAEDLKQKRPDGFCADCEARHQAAGKRSANAAKEGSLDAEQELLSYFNSGSAASGLVVATEFDDLAGLGSDEKSNHLATVFIDGNKIGNWFQFVGKNHPAQVRDLSEAVTKATEDALRAGATAIQKDPTTLSTIVHIRGGDDVLVSVPADRAWSFTLAFLDTFGNAMKKSLEGLGLTNGGLPNPTASAGIVIAKTAYPLSDSVEIADEMLKLAKRSNSGSAPAVMWVDVTRHGPKPPSTRQARSLDWLNQQTADIGVLAKLEQSTRSTLRAMCEIDHPSTQDANKIRSQSKRLGIPVRLFTEARTAEDVGNLADLLDIARWWGDAS